MLRHNIKAVIADNMALLRERRAVCDEQRRISLGQFVSLCCEDATLDSIYSASEIYNAAKELDGKLTCKEKIFVCQRISASPSFECRPSELFSDTNGNENVPQSARGRIAYVKNKQNDDAFGAFSQSISDTRAFYASTFTDCCEAVVDNKCEYCILPIENSEGGRLYSFYSLIDKYELRICHTVRIGGAETEGALYALAAKNLTEPDACADALRFEFTVVSESNEYISDIIKALHHLECALHSLDTQPVEYDNQKQKCIFSVDVPSGALIPLLLYLANEHPAYTPIGVYKIDKEI